ncbi:MAG: hypothetical protein JW750_03960 [Anaerolineaceae bacterium]|nr:hypothetical protein [Anaerolineaceae bacterium]
MDVKNRFIVAITSGAVLGILSVFLFPNGAWGITWLSTTVLTTAAVYFLLAAWIANGGEKKLGWLTGTAFVSRLLVGIFFMLTLPVWGYDNDQQNAGYLFKDAYTRDTSAWTLAVTDESLTQTFQADFFTDQYGGLAFLSAAVYRFFSPDTHRPYLVLILTSFVFAVGLPYFYRALRLRWGEKFARAASWVLVLYPEGIFFTASQMREPILIGLSMILMWGVVVWRVPGERRKALLLGIPVCLISFLISWRAFLGLLIGLSVWFVLERFQEIEDEKERKQQFVLMGVALIVFLVVILFMNRSWLTLVGRWDTSETMRSSGWATMLLEDASPLAQNGFMAVYGLLQVVLPAAIIETAGTIWRVTSVTRSLGWYLLLPILLYSFIAVWKEKRPQERMILIWLLLSTWGWLIISSVRAGGDQWDNPRYRTIFLPWLAFWAVWVWRHRGAWMWRIVAIEAFAVLMFTEWYLSRYLVHWPRPSFWQMIIYIGGFSGLVIGQGAIQELILYLRSKKSKKSKIPSET